MEFILTGATGSNDTEKIKNKPNTSGGVTVISTDDSVTEVGLGGGAVAAANYLAGIANVT